MSSLNHAIIIPGLGNDVGLISWITKSWETKGIVPHVIDAGWKTEEPLLQPKLVKAIALVDELFGMGKRVSIIGNSAGSSFAMNIFEARKEKIHKIVINCGRARTGDLPWFTFDQATSSSQSFKEACVKSEKIVNELSADDKRKMLTLRPSFDEIVPASTVVIDGANDQVIPLLGHSLTIGYNLTFGRGIIFSHIKNP